MGFEIVPTNSCGSKSWNLKLSYFKVTATPFWGNINGHDCQDDKDCPGGVPGYYCNGSNKCDFCPANCNKCSNSTTCTSCSRFSIEWSNSDAISCTRNYIYYF